MKNTSIKITAEKLDLNECYEFVTDDVIITHPIGNEQFSSSEVEAIQ